jgi:hypothetical protein
MKTRLSARALDAATMKALEISAGKNRMKRYLGQKGELPVPEWAQMVRGS